MGELGGQLRVKCLCLKEMGHIVHLLIHRELLGKDFSEICFDFRIQSPTISSHLNSCSCYIENWCEQNFSDPASAETSSSNC
jgi:hypothetical protein